MAESEDRYRRGRIAPDARKGQQGLVGGRDFSGVVAGDDRGGFVEAEGAAGVAQAAPLAVPRKVSVSFRKSGAELNVGESAAPTSMPCFIASMI